MNGCKQFVMDWLKSALLNTFKFQGNFFFYHFYWQDNKLQDLFLNMFNDGSSAWITLPLVSNKLLFLKGYKQLYRRRVGVDSQTKKTSILTPFLPHQPTQIFFPPRGSSSSTIASEFVAVISPNRFSWDFFFLGIREWQWHISSMKCCY